MDQLNQFTSQNLNTPVTKRCVSLKQKNQKWPTPLTAILGLKINVWNTKASYCADKIDFKTNIY